MDFTKPTNQERHQRKPRGVTFRIIRFLSLTFASLLLFALAVPTLLSTEWARLFIVTKINTAIAPATLSIAESSFAWFSQQEIKNVVYTDERQGIKATIPLIKTNSLWSLLPLGIIHAEISVESPDIVYTPVAKTPLPLQGGETFHRTAPSTEKTAPIVLPTWDLTAHVVVNKCSFRLSTLPEPVLSDLHLDLLIPSFQEDITATLTTALFDAQASAELTTAGLNALVTRDGVPLRTATFKCTAPWGNALIEASAMNALPYPQATLSLSLDLPKVLLRAQTLGFAKEDLSIRSGSLSLKAGLLPQPSGILDISSELSSRDIVCEWQGKPLTLSPHFSLRALVDPAHPLDSQLKKFSLEFPGLLASGKGRIGEGELIAALDVVKLLTTFRPFLGIEPPASPLSAKLKINSQAKQLSLNASAESATQKLCTLTFSADGIVPATQAFGNAKLNSEVHLGALNEFFNVAALQRCQGTAYLNATAIGSLDTFKANALFALRNIQFKTTSWAIDEGSLADASMSLSRAKNTISISDLTLKTPLVTTQGTATFDLSRAICSATLKGTLTPHPLFAKWRVWGADETQFIPTGTAAYTLSVAPGKNSFPQLSLSLASEDLQIALAPQRPFACPLKLIAKTADESKGILKLETFILESPYLSATASGDFIYDTQSVRLQGNLTPDFEKLWSLPFADAYRELLSITGRNTRAFSFETPLGDGMEGVANYGKGTAEVAFDRVTFPGLAIPHGNAKVTLNNGVFAFDGRVAVNGGTVCLNPRVNLSSKPYQLTLPNESKILDEVKLTKDLLDVALKYVNPLLPGSATPTGSLTVNVHSLQMSLNEAPLASLQTQATLQTRGCSLQPNGTLGAILALTQLRDKIVTLPDQDLNFAITEGTLTSSPINMRLGVVKLTCQGSTNLLTQAIHYEVMLPLTEQLLGEKISRQLHTDILRLPIAGTVNKPTVDTAPLLAVLREFASGRIVESLSKKLDKALKRDERDTQDLGRALENLFRKKKKQ
ncbi:MAG: hypothetical protein RR982_04610 [Kiritimatiellia bacterium]